MLTQFMLRPAPFFVSKLNGELGISFDDELGDVTLSEDEEDDEDDDF